MSAPERATPTAMTPPEQALELARRLAASRRAEYGRVEPISPGPPYEQIAARLSEWAVPEPTAYEVRSTRRGGAPITWFKRLLVRLLMQFFVQYIADQSRFNVLMLSYVRTLEERVSDLELAHRAQAEAQRVPHAPEDD